MIHRPPRPLKRWFVALHIAGCIIPDREIVVETGIANPNPVRILHAQPYLAEMAELCQAPQDDANRDPLFCREVVGAASSGLLEPAVGDFCVCPGGDRHALPSWTIHAEDGDRDGASTLDTLYAVLLLDPDPLAADPSGAVAYPNYWQPGAPGRLVRADQGPYGAPNIVPVGRQSGPTWAFDLDDATGQHTFDLCNDDNSHPLPPGLHNLQVMVTDRPFFRPALRNADGTPMTTPDGQPRFGPTQFGVPDLANGASYAVTDFVFACRDPNDESAQCDCREVRGS